MHRGGVVGLFGGFMEKVEALVRTTCVRMFVNRSWRYQLSLLVDRHLYKLNACEIKV